MKRSVYVYEILCEQRTRNCLCWCDVNVDDVNSFLKNFRKIVRQKKPVASGTRCIRTSRNLTKQEHGQGFEERVKKLGVDNISESFSKIKTEINWITFLSKINFELVIEQI